MESMGNGIDSKMFSRQIMLSCYNRQMLAFKAPQSILSQANIPVVQWVVH